MWNVTVKGLFARKLRLGLTALSIILGVTFVAGTLVLTDTLHSTISSLYGNIYQRIDFEVQAPGILNIPEQILAKVRQVPGVEYANGSVSGNAQFVARDGTPVNTGIEPATGLSFDPNQQLSAFRLVEGKAPTTPDDVVMDQATAQKYHFGVGDRVRILLPGSPQTFTIAGIAELLGAGNLPGATFAAFDLPTAQQLFGAVGQLYAIDILTTPGADKPAVQHAIARLLPPGLRVVTGRTVANQQTSSTDQSLSALSTALLVFAFIALFVGAFTIFNTFSITVGQRTHELALLRIVGASRRQVFRSVLLEAGIVGLIASLIGLGLGVLAVKGLVALLSSFGASLPAGPLVFEFRTVVAGLVVGVGVTMVSAIGPAWRAVRIPPVAAIVAQSGEQETSSRRRLLIGSICVVVSVLLLGLGLGRSAIGLVGLGAAGFFIGGGMLAPTVARPMASAIGRPLARVMGISGQLGRQNSMRSPRRTAQGAAALMVGLALVSATAVVGASLAQSATSSVDNALSANLIITSSTGTFSPSVARTVAHLPGVGTSCIVYGAQFEVRGIVVPVKGVCTDHLAANVILRMNAGSATKALAHGKLLIDATTARSKHLSVGSLVAVTFPNGKSKMRIGGIFQPNALIGSYLVGSGFFQSHFPGQLPGGIAVRASRGAANLERTVTSALKSYPNLTIETRTQFEKSQTAAINQVLGLVYALLALAVIIAFIGVVNTLLLSVFERTHEIGLLRAVGMKRRQIRAMIRSEAVILSLFGAVLGVVAGTGLGAALSFSLKQQQSVTDIVIPISSLVAFLIIAALLGLGAASWPARRAAKLDVLAAIAAD
ncbi:MAG: FtsX-like permease family protein [Candidatus Dormiibacterota bacterium]